MIRRFVPILAAAALAACDSSAVQPEPHLTFIREGLDASLSVAPNAVGQHEGFAVRLDIRNTTGDTIRVETLGGCLAILDVIRDGHPIPFKGSAWGCTAAITTHTFAPGATRALTWELRAELYAENSGDVDGAPAPSGSYIVQAAHDPYGLGARPIAEGTLTLR
jgi:hypothetical protein